MAHTVKAREASLDHLHTGKAGTITTQSMQLDASEVPGWLRDLEDFRRGLVFSTHWKAKEVEPVSAEGGCAATAAVIDALTHRKPRLTGSHCFFPQTLYVSPAPS